MTMLFDQLFSNCSRTAGFQIIIEQRSLEDSPCSKVYLTGTVTVTVERRLSSEKIVYRLYTLECKLTDCNALQQLSG